MKTKIAILFAATMAAAIAEAACCCRAAGNCAAADGGCQTKVIRVGGCCRKFQVNDRMAPRPELNAPDDVASLPERERRKFAKIFELVPEQVKVKSTQNYPQRMTFMNGCQYKAIRGKLEKKLARAAKQLAAEPAVQAREVLRACDETIVFGRILTMGDMTGWTTLDLARRYGFKNAAKAVERIDDTKNMRRGLAEGWPKDDPECRDFAKLAQAANPAAWRTFLERAETLKATFAANAAGRPAAKRGTDAKKHAYDRFEVKAARELPDDVAALPNRARARFAKTFDLLPAKAVAVAEQDYAKRMAFAEGAEHAKIRSAFVVRLAKETDKLAAEPAVRPAEALDMFDEVVRYGRPLAMGDMRGVGMAELARRHGFRNVEKFVELADDERNVKIGFKRVWPETRPEFHDFETLAKKANAMRWREFRDRLAAYNAVWAKKNATLAKR